MKNHPLRLFVAVVFLALTQVASANAGTPLMWATALHLLFGNLLLGIFEGILLHRLSGASMMKAVISMIAANYFSAWLGAFLVRSALPKAELMDLNNAWRWFWILVLAAYLLTLILEWPFIAFCHRGSKDWLKRSLTTSLKIQTISYVLLFGWYGLASRTTLYGKLTVVDPKEMALPDSVMVYYISSTDGNVYQRRLNNGAPLKVHDLHCREPYPRLFAKAGPTGSGTWNLMASPGDFNDATPPLELLKNLRSETFIDPDDLNGERTSSRSTWFDFGKAPCIGSAVQSDWEFHTGFWPAEGLRGRNQRTGKTLSAAFETPFCAWTARSAVNLPTDKVIFQLGEDQICVLDPVRKQIALLCHGKAPLPAIEPSKAGK